MANLIVTISIEVYFLVSKITFKVNKSIFFPPEGIFLPPYFMNCHQNIYIEIYYLIVT